MKLSGGLFGQKPPTGGFGSTFGAPTSSAAPGFSGLGSFTPAAGKQLNKKNLKCTHFFSTYEQQTFGPTGAGFGSFGQTNTFNKPATTGFTGFGQAPTGPLLSGGMGGLGSNMMGL